MIFENFVFISEKWYLLIEEKFCVDWDSLSDFKITILFEIVSHWYLISLALIKYYLDIQNMKNTFRELSTMMCRSFMNPHYEYYFTKQGQGFVLQTFVSQPIGQQKNIYRDQ